MPGWGLTKCYKLVVHTHVKFLYLSTCPRTPMLKFNTDILSKDF